MAIVIVILVSRYLYNTIKYTVPYGTGDVIILFSTNIQSLPGHCYQHIGQIHTKLSANQLLNISTY